jgi:hypothetical protein
MPSDETSPPPAKSPRLQRVHCTSLVLLALTRAITYIDRATLALANPLIPEELGLLLSSLLGAFALAQSPAGPILDRSRPWHSKCVEPQ